MECISQLRSRISLWMIQYSTRIFLVDTAENGSSSKYGRRPLKIQGVYGSLFDGHLRAAVLFRIYRCAGPETRFLVLPCDSVFRLFFYSRALLSTHPLFSSARIFATVIVCGCAAVFRSRCEAISVKSPPLGAHFRA